MRPPAQGIVAGTLATGFMSTLMMGAKRAGLMGGMPPEKITAAFLKGRNLHVSAAQQDALATLLHFGFGACAGAMFAVVAPKRLIARVPLGMAYGTAIWAISYAGWVPALGIMPPASRDRRDRQVVMLAGHLLFGAFLGLLVGGRGSRDASAIDRAASAVPEHA